MKAYKLFTMGYCALMGACGQPGVDVSGEPKDGSTVADGAASVTSHAQRVEGVPSIDGVHASAAFAALTSSGAVTVDQLATAGTGAVGSLGPDGKRGSMRCLLRSKSTFLRATMPRRPRFRPSPDGLCAERAKPRVSSFPAAASPETLCNRSRRTIARLP